MEDAPAPTSRPAAQAAPDLARHAGRDRVSVVMFAAVVLVTLTADLALKYLAFIYEMDEVTLVPGLLSMHLTTNEGAVFGIGQGQRWFFVSVSIVAVGLILWIFWKSDARAKGFHLALALILGGALGNLYDRIRYAAVRDMLHLFPGWRLPFGWHWPGPQPNPYLYPWIFNVADVALVLGVIGVVVITWWAELQRSRAKKAAG